jgi:8-oxo-dGTP diphosphatase
MKLVVGVFVKRDRRVLFLRRVKGLWPGFWTLPGGKIEEGESPEEAARRELFEEVGIVSPLLVPVSLEHYSDPFGIECLAFMFYDYLSTDRPVNKEPYKHSRMQWFQQKSPPRQLIPPVDSFIREHPRIVLGNRASTRQLLTLLKREDTPSLYRRPKLTRSSIKFEYKIDKEAGL